MKLLFKPKRIKNQVIVITGASSGIGLATANLLASKGAKVVLSSRNESELKECIEKIKVKGGIAHAIVADVTNLKDLENLRDETINVFGGIDTWINNAGASLYGFLLDTDIEEERKLFEINFWAIRNACQIAIGTLAIKGGSIINVGGDSSWSTLPVLGMYSASKSAAKVYTDALRIELLDRNIPVSISFVRTSAMNTPFPEHGADSLLKGIPSLPAPILDPFVAAYGIARCVARPVRYLNIGTPWKMNAIIETFFPEIADEKLKKMIKGFTKGTSLTHHEIQEGLNHAPGKEGEVRGGISPH